MKQGIFQILELRLSWPEGGRRGSWRSPSLVTQGCTVSSCYKPDSTFPHLTLCSHCEIFYLTIRNLSLSKGQRVFSRYSDSLRAGRSGDRIPVRTRISASVQTVLGPTQTPIEWVPIHSRGVKRPVLGVNNPPTSSAEVTEIILLSPCAFMTGYRASFTFITRHSLLLFSFGYICLAA